MNNMTDSEHIRKSFEAWLRQQWPNRNDPYLRDCNDVEPQSTYQDQDTELAWLSWQAAYNSRGDGWREKYEELRTKFDLLHEICHEGLMHLTEAELVKRALNGTLEPKPPSEGV